MDPAPFLRGVAFAPSKRVPYPRARADDFTRLPVDTWGSAQIPAGVRLELVTDASEVMIESDCATDDLGFRGDAAGRTFQLWQRNELVAEETAIFGPGAVRLQVAHPGEPAIVYIPEGMKPSIDSIEPVGGSLQPLPANPRWVAYGDSIAEGWCASAPALTWPAIVAREQRLDVVNMGYAGAARGEIVSAEHVASLTGVSVISITHGTNCWNRIPHSAEQMYANTLAFLEVVRTGHPQTPIVVCSPLLRPDAEETPNLLGATLVDIRLAMETAVEERFDQGDRGLHLISGSGLIDETMLADDVHPNDAGHRRIADVLGPVLSKVTHGS